jgi:hypothetical protein
LPSTPTLAHTIANIMRTEHTPGAETYMSRYFGKSDRRLALDGEWIIHSENDGGAVRPTARSVAGAFRRV